MDRGKQIRDIRRAAVRAHTSVCLDADVVDAIRDLAERRAETQSELLRRLVREGVERELSRAA